MNDQTIFSISVKALILKDNKILILERPQSAESRGGTWEFPGGGLNFGETLEEALKREIAEETGLQSEILKPIYTWSIIKDESKQVIGIHFLCKVIGDTRVTLSEEHCDYAWVEVDNLLKYDMSPCIVEDLKMNHLLNIIKENITK